VLHYFELSQQNIERIRINTTMVEDSDSSITFAKESDPQIIHDCYCPACEESVATTTVLLKNIPFFRETVVMALCCPKCHFRNSQVTFGGEIRSKGERMCLKVTNERDLDRQIVKSEFATVSIPSLQLDIPAATQQGSVSTLEGFLKRTAFNLESQQPERLKLGDLNNFYRCQHVLERLRYLVEGDDVTNDDDDDDNNKEQDDDRARFPFDIVLDDPSGNSFIENLNAPSRDPHLSIHAYQRSPTQDMALGLQPSQEAIQAGRIDDNNPTHKDVMNNNTISNYTDIDDSSRSQQTTALQEPVTFSTPCPNCHESVQANTCVVNIPHFQEIVIMSLVCDYCGYRSNDIQTGGGICDHGTRISLQIKSDQDVQRDVLLSDTSGIFIPELELQMEDGGLGGLYTTVEGLLKKMHSRLTRANPFAFGDSAVKRHLPNNDGSEFSGTSRHVKYQTFLSKLNDIAEGRILGVILVLDDPLSRSFVGPLPKDALALEKQAAKEGTSSCYHHYVDKGVEVKHYDRSAKQNEVLGLLDLKTENYSPTIGMNYGTDRLRFSKSAVSIYTNNGPDHPHQTAKAPVDNDKTVMGPECKSGRFLAKKVHLQSSEEPC